MTTQSNDRALLVAFVNDCTAYQSNSVRIDSLKAEQSELVAKNGELRKSIVPVFKAMSTSAWGKIKGEIKEAIAEAGIADVDGLLGVLKTSFEYKILPTQQNADRLRKAKMWVNWNGVVVANTYKSVHAPKVEAPAPAPTPETPAPATQEAAPATAPTVQPKPSVKGNPVPIASNVSAPDLSEDELWVQHCTQFMNEKITLIVLESIENTHKLPRGTLVSEFAGARNRVMAHIADKART